MPHGGLRLTQARHEVGPELVFKVLRQVGGDVPGKVLHGGLVRFELPARPGLRERVSQPRGARAGAGDGPVAGDDDGVALAFAAGACAARARRFCFIALYLA